MTTIAFRQNFTAAGTSSYFVSTGPAVTLQGTAAGIALQGTNLPADESSWTTLGTSTSGALQVHAPYVYLRVVTPGACSVAVGCAESSGSAPASGPGSSGGAAGAALEATQVQVLGAVLDVANGIPPAPDAATAANQVTQIARLDTLVAQTDDVESMLGQVRDRLPATAHSQPLTDAQLRATPLPVSLPADSDQSAIAVLSPADPLLPAAWDLTGVQPVDIVHVEAGRNQRVIALTADPTAATAYSEMRSLAAIDTPGEVSAHLSMSQRVRMDVGVLALVDRTTLMTVPGPWTIASISQAGATCTITLTAPFIGQLGTLIDITGVSDNRLCYQFAPVASISEDRLTLTVTFTDGAAIPSITVGALTGGTLAYSPDPLGRAATGAGYVYNSSTTTSATLLARSGGVTRLASAPSALATDPRISTATTNRLAASGGTGHATGASSEYLIEVVPGEVHMRDRPADVVTTYSTRAQIQSAALAVSRQLTPVVALGGSAGIVRPLANIVSIVRASNVATITLDRAAAGAGFAVGQYPQVYGVRDQTNFGNSAFSAAVTAVSGNTVTIPWNGTNATSYGGALALPAGGLTQQGLIGQTVQSVARNSDDSITLTGSASWLGLVVDDIAWLVGVRDATTGAGLGIDGPWRVSSMSSALLTLRPVTDIAGTRRSPAVAPSASVNCGGAVLLATTVRVHSLRAVERRMSEVRIWGQGADSRGHALPVAIASSASLSVNASEVATLAASTYAAVTAATTNAAVVKSTSGHLFAAVISNPTAAAINVKLYNKTIAPTVGTDVPLLTIPVAAGGHVAIEYGRLGLRFWTGIGIAVTAAMAATDTTAVTAGAQVLLSFN